MLEEMYSDEFIIDIDYEPQLDNDEWLSQYDIIHYHRTMGDYTKMPNLLERLDKLGIATIMDLDDYWSPGPHHPAYMLIKNSGLDKSILGNIRNARNVATTTEIFANEIRKYNKNVFVLPNAIDENEKQYIPTPEQSDRIRIGWLGGSCMTPDTEILTNYGWKRFDELDQTEKVATLNPNTNDVEYHSPTAYICEPFDGQLNCANSDLVDFKVTPNHNMYASHHEEANLELIQSEKIHGTNFYVKNIKNTIFVNSESQYNEYYNGNVYCVEVQNHIIYVKRNGKPMWIGNSHLKDLELLNGVSGRLKSDGLLDKVQFVLCGFDLRGTMTMIDEKTGQQTNRPIKPMESVWYQYERIFTDDYKIVSDEYKNFLLKFKQEEYSNVANEPYRRVWTKPISTYASNYNLFDISLAPIEDNIFNQVKCIVGDSLISTNKGFKYISDIVADKLVLQTELNGVKNNVCNYFKYSNVDTIKLITEDGYEIEGTPHHKIYINNDWVELKDLKVGDNIELTKPEFLQNEYQEITYPMLLTKNITQEKINNSDDNMLPRIRINENWGRLLGYMLGDGNYNGKSSISISCDKRHKNVVDDIVNLYKSIGLNPLVYDKKIDKRCSKSLCKEGYGVDIKSTCINFLSIAKKYNWCGSHGKTFRIPKVILESPKSVIKEFLKGLFEADGTVGEHNGVSLTSKDLKLIKQVQILLLAFNITSKIDLHYNKEYKRNYYRLNLHRLGSEIFNTEIGFVSEHKKTTLSKLVSNKHSNNEKKIIFENKICEIKYTNNSVYDIEVEHVHSYNANGIKNHNSQLKVVESGFHKKALIAQDFGPYTIDIDPANKFGGVWDNKGNGILIDTNKNHKDWYKNIKKLIENPNLISELSENLYNTVKNRYSLPIVTKQRRNLYKELVSKNKT